MGSDTDLPIMSQAAKILEDFGVAYEISLMSAHRCPDEAACFAQNAENAGIKVIIAAAGLAAHLPGVIASHTILPVIGVPVMTGPINGVDALFSIVQMPSGVPVAAVGINSAKNAAYLALEILATGDEALKEKLRRHKDFLKQEILNKNSRLHEKGWQEYLAQMIKEG